VMQTIQTSSVPVEQLKALAQFVQNAAGPELRDVLLSVSRCISEGADLAVIEAASATLTPAEAAERLGMSRTHLYKLLDRGEIVAHRVGRDRRIRVADLVAFEEQRQSDRRELAEHFAKQRQTRDAAVDEVADLL
jgi:excisionase family DNA binding protein